MGPTVVAVSGGDRLQAKLKEIADRVSTSETLRVGFLENATYQDGTPVAMVAAIQEFGAPAKNIPSRPFFRSMLAAKSPEWGATLAKMLRAHDYDATASLSLMGDGIKGQLKQSIVDTNTPPLAPATVAAKGSAKPLVDTGHMLNSVDYEVS